MNAAPQPAAMNIPVDDREVQMMRYALSPEGRDTIAIAQREIDEGKGIVADDDYFAALKDRRAKALDAR